MMANTTKRIEKQKKSFQIFAIFSGSFASLGCGCLLGWTSPSIPKLIEDTSDYDITMDEASYLTILPAVGAVISCFLYSYLNDNLGRKYTMLLIVVPQISSLLITAFAKSIWLFYLARLFAGFGDSNLFSTLPMYVGEITTPKVRGTWGNIVAVFIYLGSFLINIYGSYFSIRTAAFISLSAPILFFITFSFMPESPYFCLMKGQTEDAKKSLRILRQVDDVEEEFTKLQSDVQRQMSEAGTWVDLFTIRSNLKALWCGIFLRVSQQMSGAAAFTAYTQYIFAKSGTTHSPASSATLFVGLMTILNIAGSFTLEKLGRKKSFFYSLLFCGLALLAESVYFYLEQYYKNVISLKEINWIPLAGMISWVFFYSFGLGIVPTLMLGELFSTSIKGKGLCMLNITFSVVFSLGSKIFQLLQSNIGMFAPFGFFAACCFISTILSVYIIPETKGKTLEEIQQDLKGKGNGKSKENESV